MNSHLILLLLSLSSAAHALTVTLTTYVPASMSSSLYFFADSKTMTPAGIPPHKSGLTSIRPTNSSGFVSLDAWSEEDRQAIAKTYPSNSPAFSLIFATAVTMSSMSSRVPSSMDW